MYPRFRKMPLNNCIMLIIDNEYNISRQGPTIIWFSRNDSTYFDICVLYFMNCIDVLT